MALATGDVWMEEVTADRRVAPWDDRAHDRRTTLGTAGLVLVRDRAKALRKLAHTGRGCLSLPEVLPLRPALAQRDALAIFGRLRHAKRDCAQAQQGHLEQGQGRGAACAPTLHPWQGGQCRAAAPRPWGA